MNKNNSSRNRRWLAHAIVFALTLILPPIVGAQEAGTQTAEAVDPQPMPEEVAADLTKRYEAIGTRQAEITQLERLRVPDGDVRQRMFDVRLDRAWIGLLEDGVAFLDAVSGAQDSGYILGEYAGFTERVLKALPEVAATAWSRMNVALVVPAADESAAEQAAGYARLFDVQRTTDQIFDTYLRGLELAEEGGIDISSEMTKIKRILTERAINASIFLEMSLDDVKGVRAGIDALPDDAELKAKLKVAENRVSETAGALERLVGQMEPLDLDTSAFRAQLLTATGAITTDIFDITVIGKLLSRWGMSLFDSIAEQAPTLLFQLIIFVVIIYFFRKLAIVVEKLVGRALETSKFHLSLLLKRMLKSSAGNLVLALGVLIALSQLGISLGPVLAGLGVAGFVIGFALQDALGNFASGMLMLFYRPFDVGDIVEVGGVFGKVHNMSLVNTTVLTLDNQTIVMPNNMIWSGVIKNLSNQRQRRVDLVFGVSYTDDIPQVEKILQEAIDANEMILDEPEPNIRVHELGDSSVNFIVRPWVKSDDYWDVYWDMTRDVKMRFDAAGISIPFPQTDVHLYTQDAVPDATPASEGKEPEASRVRGDSAPDAASVRDDPEPAAPSAQDGREADDD